MSTSLLVSTGAVSCYPALMVNLIWFADEDRDRKMQLLRNLDVIVHSLARTCERPAIPLTHKFDRFAHFCGCNCKTSKICHQRTRFFTIGAGLQLAAPVETSRLVPVTYYDVSVMSRLAKNI